MTTSTIDTLLLPEEPVLRLQPRLVHALGLVDALVLQQIHEALQHPQRLHDGRPWITRTYSQWQQDFAFLSTAQVSRACRRLRALHILRVAQINGDRWNRANSYAIDYECLTQYLASRRTVRVVAVPLVPAPALARTPPRAPGKRRSSPPPAALAALLTDPESGATPAAGGGYIYVLGVGTRLYKIGHTRHLFQRVADFLTTLPLPVTLWHSFAVSDPGWAERYLHRRFAARRAHGEWFALEPDDLHWLLHLVRLEAAEVLASPAQQEAS
jgi:hypothetical protein